MAGWPQPLLDTFRLISLPHGRNLKGATWVLPESPGTRLLLGSQRPADPEERWDRVPPGVAQEVQDSKVERG